MPIGRFDSELATRLRASSQVGIPDVDAAFAMARLAHEELEAFGTDGNTRLSNEESSILLRSLGAVLRRLSIDAAIPFYDLRSFRGYWIENEMANSWAARRKCLQHLFAPIFHSLSQLDAASKRPGIRGVNGEMKNIIFASTGAKPEIVLRDAINNIIEVVRFAEYSLVYNRPLAKDGLTWRELTDWWREETGADDSSEIEVLRSLCIRLLKSLGSPVEKTLFNAYCTYCKKLSGPNLFELPALIPQVYLHFDPLTKRERTALGKENRLGCERMDFLMLLSNGARVVLEVDGKQHYADGDTASPSLYSKMMSEDRALRLRGYELYRFGGSELMQKDSSEMLENFFDMLAARHS